MRPTGTCRWLIRSLSYFLEMRQSCTGCAATTPVATQGSVNAQGVVLSPSHLSPDFSSIARVPAPVTLALWLVTVTVTIFTTCF